jgi:uncharacterized coiled-coil DUF342 family protein
VVQSETQEVGQGLLWSEGSRASVTSRPPPSGDLEREEREDRQRLRALDARLGDLQRLRQGLLEQIGRLSEEQKSLYQDRQSQQLRLEDLHRAHQELGKSVTETRRRREEARRTFESALADSQVVKGEVRASELPRPAQIRREIAALERKQQTTALPLSEENQLIDRLRELSKLLGRSTQMEAIRDQRLAERHAAEERVRSTRSDWERQTLELRKVHAARDHAMEEMREGLVEAGRLVAALRERARERSSLVSRLEGVNREIGQLERQGDRVLAAIHARRIEARRAVQQYAPKASRAAPREEAESDFADAQMQELMRRGRITLGGSP